jgi:hypothetical protein
MHAKKLSKEAIVNAYQDLVKKRAGRLVGGAVFTRETGISPYHWNGGYWRSWSAFQEDLGFTPNAPTARIDDETLLQRFADLAVELRHMPTQADLKLKRKADSSFPGEDRFRRWGNRDALLSKVQEYCNGKPQYAEALGFLEADASASLEARLNSFRIAGFVYLLRSGKHYKIGRTNATGRRLRELAIQLPSKPDTVHVIETDDPEGIERYWHQRFSEKRQGGEWFSLSTDEIRAFKRRRFQ